MSRQEFQVQLVVKQTRPTEERRRDFDSGTSLEGTYHPISGPLLREWHRDYARYGYRVCNAGGYSKLKISTCSRRGASTTTNMRTGSVAQFDRRGAGTMTNTCCCEQVL